MEKHFITFFAMIAFTAILSVFDNWIIQHQLYGQVSVARAIFQVGLIALILYLLWGRTIPGYVLAIGYAIANAALYSYELAQYFLLGNTRAELSTSATLISIVLVLTTIVALFVLTLDYVDYRKHREPDSGI
jgi:hypothetical protein